MTENITNLDELKKAIAVLELEKAEKEEQLQTQFNLTLKSINPINLLKNSIKEKVAAPNLGKTILGAAVGISFGYALKKFVVRGSANILRQLFGTLLQFGTINLLANKANVLKRFGRFISSRFPGQKIEKAQAL
jgi:hypothetical protein